MSSNTKVITPTATLSYPHIDKAQPGKPGQDPKFSASLVFDAGADLKTLQAAAIAAATDFFGATIAVPGGKNVAVADAFALGILKSPFRKDGVAKGYPEGSIFINVRTKNRPGCVYAHAGEDGKTPARVPAEKIKDEFYPGAKVRASVAAFGYNTDGNKGVSFALNNLQKMGEGERIDGRVDATKEFDVDLSQAPADISGLI